ncbi:hypothetical protein FQN60_002397 [Etheostoma spectabile]|uniref:Uncharacterized protein n=1 Tax=Etheostoma spectabile TaxID=54343 RepID=A0A5J5DCG6_9PERO|nr:hypothetical protein FQN60_002397 [Etheostoma spectabile]
MMDVETSYSDFINCDRTGRRNAVPDIAGKGEAAASTSELTKDLAEMDLKAAGSAAYHPIRLSFEFVLGESHVVVRGAVVEEQGGVEDQRVVNYQTVTVIDRWIDIDPNDPMYYQRSSPDDRMLGEVWVAGTCQLTGNRTHLQAERQTTLRNPLTAMFFFQCSVPVADPFSFQHFHGLKASGQGTAGPPLLREQSCGSHNALLPVNNIDQKRREEANNTAKHLVLTSATLHHLAAMTAGVAFMFSHAHLVGPPVSRVGFTVQGLVPCQVDGHHALLNSASKFRMLLKHTRLSRASIREGPFSTTARCGPASLQSGIVGSFHGSGGLVLCTPCHLLSKENTFGNYEIIGDLMAHSRHLRNHVHVLLELAQERGEGGRLLDDNGLPHLLHRICWQTDVASPRKKILEENNEACQILERVQKESRRRALTLTQPVINAVHMTGQQVVKRPEEMDWLSAGSPSSTVGRDLFRQMKP